jgi:hypothetical protein
MKTSIKILLLLFGVQNLLLANPIDNTPIVKFSELVFDNSNNWTMEITSTFGMSFDSVIFISSSSKAKLKVSYPTNQHIAIITSDSLTAPLLINREGDKIVIYTYSSFHSGSTIILTRSDSIIYGNYPCASVGEPISGYSIMRIFLGFSGINMTIDCLTKYPSLGIVNDTLNLSGTLKGHIYDSNNKLVCGLKVLYGWDTCYYVLETPLAIDSTGTYSTKIFQTICSPTKLLVEYQGEFGEEIDSVAIEPFELKNSHPDTVVVQDIHLKDDRYITSVNNKLSAINDELTIMNYPNPFNLSTNFFVKIPDNLKSKAIDISIVNITGQLIRNISPKAGQVATWDGKDSGGTIMPSGVYFYRLAINKQIMKTGSMILLK